MRNNKNTTKKFPFSNEYSVKIESKNPTINHWFMSQNKVIGYKMISCNPAMNISPNLEIWYRDRCYKGTCGVVCKLPFKHIYYHLLKNYLHLFKTPSRNIILDRIYITKFFGAFSSLILLFVVLVFCLVRTRMHINLKIFIVMFVYLRMILKI